MNEEALNRLREEARELAKKLNLLNKFMASDKFPALDRQNKDLLYQQSRTMSGYLQILGQRLELNGLIFSHSS